jgi:hypothetical protein
MPEEAKCWYSTFFTQKKESFLLQWFSAGVLPSKGVRGAMKSVNPTGHQYINSGNFCSYSFRVIPVSKFCSYSFQVIPVSKFCSYSFQVKPVSKFCSYSFQVIPVSKLHHVSPLQYVYIL